MYHKAVNVLVNTLIAATLLSFSSSSLTRACGSKTKVVDQAEPTYDVQIDVVRVRHQSRHTGVRFRRGVEVDQESGEELGLTTPLSISNAQVFDVLDLDVDDEVSVIEWSIEGGSVADFWALLSKHDNNADEMISREEFAPVQVQVHL
ncbi:uncharacterized protein LOC121424563 [Lytechinus variegatus]|uniref:uncharacterized protein LOC121424563 n=1 Tax=Lytechinus variegatus TaxID=7654 RepID=UPI001BB13B63|nr:uncharacterized protein LOC121424563 [Lytechinus variegatus]